jgi:hypothetical protein
MFNVFPGLAGLRSAICMPEKAARALPKPRTSRYESSMTESG